MKDSSIQSQIHLGNGNIAIVDPHNFDRLDSFDWHMDSRGYARASVGGSKIWMHRLILNAPVGVLVDHIDGDRLNNVEANLRLATKSQNAANTHTLRPDNKSGYRGVCLNGRGTKWRAQIRYLGKKIYLGSFDSPIEAARAYDEAAFQLFGEFATINGVAA